MVINKRTGFRTEEIQNILMNFLPQLKVESDIFDGDVVFRTNQQPDDQFVQALRKLEHMKKGNSIKNFGVQNSTMDDVFLKITNESKGENGNGTTAVNIENIGLYKYENECLF